MNSVSTLFNNSGSKLQKVHFQAKITTESLTDVPLIKGLFFCKFKLKKGNISYRAHAVETASVDQSAVNSISDSTFIPDDKSSMTINNNDMSVMTQSGSKGRTPIMPLKDHAVVWNHTNVFNVILIVRGDNSLQPCEMIISVKKEIAGSKKAETYGKVVIDLAEFAATKFSTRQYLLQDSKSNSTLKISVDMKQIFGEPLLEHDTSISNNSINNNSSINQNPFLNVQSQPQTAIPGFNSTESLDSDEYVDYFPCDYGAIYGDKYKQFGSHMDIVQQLYNRVMNPKELLHHPHDRHKIAVRTSSNPVLTFTTPSPRSP